VKTHSFVVEQMTDPYSRLDMQRTSFDHTSYLLPPNRTSHAYTLVLDLDETLVHYDAPMQQFRVRPYCREFLASMSQIFEVVVFTAAHEDYANSILD
jgi:CTD small phosphatase-like protein 2